VNVEQQIGGTFEAFAEEVAPRLRHALVARFGPEVGADAAIEALLYAWQNWERIAALGNPIGYLYRVGQTRGRGTVLRPSRVSMPPVDHDRDPLVEPGLPVALAALTAKQRTGVILVHSFQYTLAEAAEVLGVTKSSVQTHLDQGLAKLRVALEVDDVS